MQPAPLSLVAQASPPAGAKRRAPVRATGTLTPHVHWTDLVAHERRTLEPQNPREGARLGETRHSNSRGSPSPCPITRNALKRMTADAAAV